jgi:hypothetical protein
MPLKSSQFIIGGATPDQVKDAEELPLDDYCLYHLSSPTSRQLIMLSTVNFKPIPNRAYTILGYTFLWSSGCLAPKSYIIELLNLTADSPVDILPDEIILPSRQPRDSLYHLKDIVQRGGDEDVDKFWKLITSDPPGIMGFQGPQWEASLKEAREVWQKWSAEIGMALLYFSLAGGRLTHPFSRVIIHICLSVRILLSSTLQNPLSSTVKLFSVEQAQSRVTSRAGDHSVRNGRSE